MLFGPRAQDVKRRETEDYHACFFGPGKVYLMKLNPFAPALTGPLRTSLPSAQTRVQSAAYALTGDLLICGTDAGEVFVLHIETGAVICAAQRMCKLGVRQICVLQGPSTGFSAESAHFGAGNASGFRYARFGPGSLRRTEVVVGSGDGGMVHCVIDDHTEPCVRVVSHAALPHGILALSATQDERGFVATLCNGQTWTVALDRGQQSSSSAPAALRLDAGSARLVSDACLAPIHRLSMHPADPAAFVTCTGDGAVTKWDLNSYLVTKTFDAGVRFASGAPPICTCAQIIAGLDIQVSGWSDGYVRCHDFQSGEMLWCVAKTHRGAVSSLLVAPSLRFYVTGGDDGDVKAWDMRTRELKFVLSDHKQSVLMLHLLGTETHLISASRDRTTVSWDMNRRRRITCHESSAGTTTAAAVAKDECRVLVAGAGGSFDEWDLRQKDRARTASYALHSRDADSDANLPPTPSQPVPGTPFATCLRRAPQNVPGCVNYFATGGSNHVVQIWDDRQLRPVETGVGHSAAVGDVCYTCDGRQLVSGAADRALLVWNVYQQ